ncbi:MAG TPA: DUF1080 domain-containing protein [Cyclobacteriaceae bacterium]|nr:DUF1080 domain-containing protein [Cyclobacteriaceae bacterium]
MKLSLKRTKLWITALFVSMIILSCSNKDMRQSSATISDNLPIPNPDSTGWSQLFNGRDLTGWEHVGDGFMTVENGEIHTNGGMGLLYWKAGKLGKCVIRIMWRMTKENDNSGVFIRIPIEPREAWMPVFYGYEVQIDNHPELSDEDIFHSTGMLYAFTKPLVENAWKPGPEWNTFEITLDGPRTLVLLNGVKVTDYNEGDPVPERKFDFEPFPGPRPESGYFGLQNHGEHDIVYYKEVAVKPLN